MTQQLTIDLAHSEINFIVKHMMFAKVKGTFEKFSGTINLDESNILNSSVEVEIDPSSINTRDENRDNHLRSNDFFGVEQNPVITFKSTRIEAGKGSGDYKVYGDLTMNGVTKEVVLDAEFTGKGVSPMGPTVYGFSATTTLNRKDFGMNWNAALEAGGVLVSDEVKIEIEIEANPAA
ncbi:MAG TPA: YceI family protein [Thermomicrobiales bacterium]|jgi:polyisoprenoid-binding protein YceI|nr:YceI family protein [Thermomicrobiales bacterium]